MVNDRTIFLVVGMAGSGKTTFCQRLYSWISQNKCEVDKKTGLNKDIYSINLDPAVYNPKMPLNLDIRDVIDYHGTMEKYNLGPNGAISTCLNLFLINIDEIINKIEGKYVIIDTPGQIEAFTWSSPGQVLVQGLKLTGSIVILYIVDSVISKSPAVFMSNMMYSASLMCRFNVPTLCVFNKIDESDTTELQLWLRDYEAFRERLPDDDMFSPILGSMALYFEEFYNSLATVEVSAFTGEGKKEFFDAVSKLRE